MTRRKWQYLRARVRCDARTYPPEAEATAPLIKPSGGGLADAPTTTAGGGEPRWAVLPGWGDAERWYDLEAGTDWYDLRLSRTAQQAPDRPRKKRK